MASLEPTALDINFRPQHLSCGFHGMTYDVIGHYENEVKDSKTILEFAGLWEEFGSHGWPRGAFLTGKPPAPDHRHGNDRSNPCHWYRSRTFTMLEQMSGHDFGPLFGYSLDTWRQACSSAWDNMTVYVYTDRELEMVNKEALQCYLKSQKVSLWRDERSERAQDSAEVWLHAFFLRHPNRVMDPDHADFLFVP
eukprot:3936456-Rhodomonas_salina.1